MQAVYESLKATFLNQASRAWVPAESEYRDTLVFFCDGDRLNVNTDVEMAFLYENREGRSVIDDSSAVAIRFRNPEEFAAFRKALGQ